MDGIRAGRTRRGQHLVGGQITFHGRRGSQADRAIGERDVQRPCVGVRVDGHRFNA